MEFESFDIEGPDNDENHSKSISKSHGFGLWTRGWPNKNFELKKNLGSRVTFFSDLVASLSVT